MALNYKIEYRDSVIEVQVSGTPDGASLGQMWKHIIAATREFGCFYILGVSAMDQPMKLADAVDHQAIFLEAGVTVDHRVAWVQLNPDAVAMNRIVESMSLNRGLLNGRLFTDESEARRWLAGR